jgi:hypothetical protein
MSYGVLIPLAIAAQNIDSYIRSAVCADDLENGSVVKLTTRGVATGQGEVWTAVVPSTGNGLTGLWMVYEPEIVVTVSGTAQYKGLDPNPQNFLNLATKVFTVFKPSLGDLVRVTGDALAGSVSTYVNATNSSGGYSLYWGGSQTGSVMSMKLLATTYISIATGAMDTQRVVAYDFEVVGL